MTSIVLILGHPDGGSPHFCHALAETYQTAAEGAGHQVAVLNLGLTDIPLLRDPKEWEADSTLQFVTEAQGLIEKADHLVFVYPLWLGDVPAVLKAWLEQVLRPGFALERGGQMKPRLRGRSARVIVTMGMPAVFYRWFYFAHSLRSFERNILRFCGIKPVKTTLFGGIGDTSGKTQRAALRVVRDLGEAGA